MQTRGNKERIELIVLVFRFKNFINKYLGRL